MSQPHNLPHDDELEMGIAAVLRDAVDRPRPRLAAPPPPPASPEAAPATQMWGPSPQRVTVTHVFEPPDSSSRPDSRHADRGRYQARGYRHLPGRRASLSRSRLLRATGLRQARRAGSAKQSRRTGCPAAPGLLRCVSPRRLRPPSFGGVFACRGLAFSASPSLSGMIAVVFWLSFWEQAQPDHGEDRVGGTSRLGATMSLIAVRDALVISTSDSRPRGDDDDRHELGQLPARLGPGERSLR